MPKMDFTFIPTQGEPTDEQLLLQVVCGLCDIGSPREEPCRQMYNSVGIPYPYIRRLAKLLVEKLQLPVPVDRVDHWVESHRHNRGWEFSVEDRHNMTELKQLTSCEVSR